MITSIRTLESDNVLYQSELNELKHSVFSDKKQADLKLLNTLSITEKEVGSKKCEKLSRNKLMILSDQQGRNFNKIFQSVTNKFSVESFIKSGASFLSVIENIKELTSSYNQNDYVIVVAGLNDFRNGKVPPLKNIMAKLSNCVHTNIVVLSEPFGKFDEWTKNQIYEFNGMLKKYLNQFRHIFFMDTNINNLLAKIFLQETSLQKSWKIATRISVKNPNLRKTHLLHRSQTRIQQKIPCRKIFYPKSTIEQVKPRQL
ncbi:hypothetical protein JTB14_008434 [Gonioctena quinquepunctata]|nr:hypothetical protein JTB14_008434 [Gonioctena quinquepunctata]